MLDLEQFRDCFQRFMAGFALANRRDSDSTVGMVSFGPARQCAGAAGRRHELRSHRESPVADDTIRTWYRLYEEDGIEGLASFGREGGACRLSEEQQDRLKACISDTLPWTTREVGAWIEKECGIEYQGRSGLIALLHRLGMEHRKPKTVSRKLDPEKQAAFIKAYEELLNRLDADEVVLFADAVHPTHAVRPVGCWCGLRSFWVCLARRAHTRRLTTAPVLSSRRRCSCSCPGRSALSPFLRLPSKPILCWRWWGAGHS